MEQMQANIADLTKQLAILKGTKVEESLYLKQVEATEEVQRILRN